MSNIERKYSYLDEGVFPEIGEYGVTYLTLYSSGAGNVYDGWMWDPDRVHYSETERTFGYRNPDYPDYCWDDEVVVDLSNAQTRQETSDFAQGRITSFNTNVSSRPIVLQDIDITGLDEEEREALATTVLFSAIPLVKDAYIQAMVEVQMKVNLSPTNTNGMVRVEAFYILNDESDRTMRPNPVHTFAVSTANERHTLPWLYWNPALNHEDNNYIGVKLLCTGGTAEIGISDDPEYGDAMITLTSAGLTGDHIDSGYPVSLDIYGKTIVPPRYKLKESDYTVLCTYDTGEVYEVTRLCEFTPPMGTKVVDPVTTLTANYQGLTASMSVVLAQLENIELIGLTDFYEDTYTLNIDDYIVMAYYDTGDIMDITDDEELIFDPPMGTVINTDTTLTATYSPEYMPGSEFEDSLEIVKHISTGYAYNYYDQYGDGLRYESFNDGSIVITGKATHDHGLFGDNNDYGQREPITIPRSIINNLPLETIGGENFRKCSKLIWDAEGDICGITSHMTVQFHELKNFEGIQIKPLLYRVPWGVSDIQIYPNGNPIQVGLTYNQRFLTSESLDFYKNIDFESDFQGTNGCGLYGTNSSGNANDLRLLCYKCESLENLNFLSVFDFSKVNSLSNAFNGCINLEDIRGLVNANVSNVESCARLFEGCVKLKSAGSLFKWKLIKCHDVGAMFRNSGLENVQGLSNLNIGYSILDNENLHLIFSEMFMGCEYLTDLLGIENLINSNYSRNNITVYLAEMFRNCSRLSNINPIFGWPFNNVTSIEGMFLRDTSLSSINSAGVWNLIKCEDFTSTFGGQDPYNPSILDASEIYWQDPINRYRNGDLGIGNFFIMQSYGHILRIKTYGIPLDHPIPGYEDKMVSCTSGGVFGGLDAHYIEGSVHAGEIVTGTLVYVFIYTTRLPDWYKQMIVDDAYNYYNEQYPGNAISISYA